jgi:hypothetical protein
MKHLKTYNESRVYLSEERQLDITKIYADCFMELSDLNAYIYVDNYNDDIKKVVDGTAIVFTAISNNLWKMNKTDELTIKIKGYSKYEPIYNNNESKLREIYEYLKQNLKNDEYRFSKIANVNIENVYTRIDVETAGTDYVNSFERDMKHPSIISSTHTGDIMTSYTIDPTNKPKHGIIRKIKSFLHGDKDYNFPDINPRDKITQIEIMHKITGL